MIEFLAANWLWIAAIVFFVVMHRGGHGCGMHGSHGSHGGHGGRASQTGHQHAGHHHTDQNRPVDQAETDRSTT